MRMIKGCSFCAIFFVVVALLLSACGGGGGSGGGSSTGPVVPDPNQTLQTGTSVGGAVARVDSDGNRTVFYSSSGSLVSQRYVNNAWQAPETVFSNRTVLTLIDFKAIGQGRLLVAWMESVGPGQFAVNVSFYDPSSGWATPSQVTLDISGAGCNGLCEIRVDGDVGGNATVAWTRRQGLNFGYYNLWSSRYTPATGWSTPELRSSQTYDVSNIHIGSDLSGNIELLWMQGSSVMFSRYTGSWTPPQTVMPGQAYAFDAAMNKAGDIVVATEGSDGLHTARYTSAGGWEPPQLHANTANAFSPSYDPTVSINEAGDAMVLLATTGYTYSYYSVRYTAGIGWSPLVVFDHHRVFGLATTSSNAGFVVEVIGGTYQYAGNPLVIQSFDPVSGWSAAQTIDSSPYGSGAIQVSQPLALNDSGVGFIAWTEYTGTTNRIRARLIPN